MPPDSPCGNNCVDCRGKGKISKIYLVPCYSCDNGIIFGEKCYQCQGKGSYLQKEWVPCATCGGSGVK